MVSSHKIHRQWRFLLKNAFSTLALLVLTLTSCRQPLGDPKGASQSAVLKQAMPVLMIEDNDGAEEIVKKMIRAYGGEQKLSRWNVGRITYKTNIRMEPFADTDIIMEDTFQLPGQFKRVMHARGQGKPFSMTWVLSDGKGWLRRGDDASQPFESDQSEQLEHPLSRFCNVGYLLDPELRLSVIGDENVWGSSTVVLRAESPKSRSGELSINKATALLAKSKYQKARPGSGENETWETLFGAYKSIDGGMVPTRIVGYRQHKLLIDFTLTDVKFYDWLDEGEFAKP
jgi:hypothetical protein